MNLSNAHDDSQQQHSSVSSELEHVTTRRGRFDAVVVRNRQLCSEHYELQFRVPGEPRVFPPTQPGQFIQLGCRTPLAMMEETSLRGGDLEWQPGQPLQVMQAELRAPVALLRRPFSLAGRVDDPDDESATLTVIHRVVGTATRWLEHLKPGDSLDLIGPLGNHFRMPAHKCMALLVGGGVGLPPMFYLARILREQGWDGIAFIGATTRDLLAVDWVDQIEPDPTGLPKMCVQQFEQCFMPSVITTDDGSLGLRGRITDGLVAMLQTIPRSLLDQTVIFVCGPNPMMRAVAELAQRYDVDTQVCLEQAMACGMGTCQSCIVKIEDHLTPQACTPAPENRPWRYRLACTDGPVFDARSVVW